MLYYVLSGHVIKHVNASQGIQCKIIYIIYELNFVYNYGISK